jgi:branched-chain amino acid transport system permease protein
VAAVTLRGAARSLPWVLLAAAVLVAAWAVPLVASGTSLDTIALSLTLAGPAAGTALAAAAGRPMLAGAALAGVGAYSSGLASLHGTPVPVAILLGTAAAATAGAVIGLVGARMNAVAFLLTTALVAAGLGAAVQAVPAITGAQSGLGPLPPLSLPLSDSRTAVLTPLGGFQLVLVTAGILAGLALLLSRHGPGPRWRAIGSDRARAAASRLRPTAGEVTVLAVAGAGAGLMGALGAHVSRVATPSLFALDVAALPLLAALAAGNRPLRAALIAVATGLAGRLLLPDIGWQGPPTAASLALAVLAATTLVALRPRHGRVRTSAPRVVDVGAPWPLAELDLRGARWDSGPLSKRARDGAALVDAPSLAIAAGSVHGIVGANGSGKTTLLTAINEMAGRRPHGARVVLLPQAGGGFSTCTVMETLLLAGRPGRTGAEAAALASAWARRLGFDHVSGNRLCGELPGSDRRLVDLARVLLGRPEVLLCDEPLAGLDERDRAAIVSCLAAAAEAGLTVVIAEHDGEALASLTTSITELHRADLAAAPMATAPATT